MIEKNIELVNQINDSTCVHACLSMITGIDIEKIIDELPQPCGPSQYLPWLVLYNVLPIQEHRLFYGALSLVTIPSRNKRGFFHVILVDLRFDDAAVVYDPQQGRTVDGVDREHVTDMDDLHSLCAPVRLIDCDVPVEPGEV